MSQKRVFKIEHPNFRRKTDNSHVTEETVKKMEQRRDWATIRLCTWYKDHNLENPDLRLEKILLLLDEIEIVCDMHCQDFIVAKMYEFCDMSQFFYEKLCYAPCNTNIDNVDPDFFEKFRQYAKGEKTEKEDIKRLPSDFSSNWKDSL
ncbi:hypothetical protein CRE_10419 [Caenorhabditis remanei]|uniref:Uncharacterized protein n=1 Tax=Caenorhabditis remanei TaxID=31234 RepID=E3MQN6_CAERE|nr:hypothetical protein CRE_10419 [Caenorhabditis remanei]